MGPAAVASAATGGGGNTANPAAPSATTGTSATAGTSATNGSAASLQTQAQELAGQIAADGRALDELDASYQAAQINYSRLSAKQDQLRQAMAAASAAAAQARKVLKEQALLAYLTGGAPLISYLPGRAGLDPSLTVAYAQIVAGGQKTAADAYRATLAAETQQKVALDANARQVALTLASIKSDEVQASATLDSEQKALSQVKGQLAAEVAKVQAQQQAAEQTREESLLAARGDLPSTTSATNAAAPTTTGTAPPAPAAGSAAPTGAGTSTTASHSQPTLARVAAPVTTARPTVAPSTAAPTPPPTSAPTPTPSPSAQGGQSTTSGTPAQAPGVSAVLAYARAQLGKPYQWAGAGPNSFDCSGLVMMAWDQAGIYFPHLAQDQYDMTARIPLSQMIPGDLVFFGTPDNVYHVGIYVGNGDMIDAAHTGVPVRIADIHRPELLGAGRPG